MDRKQINKELCLIDGWTKLGECDTPFIPQWKECGKPRNCTHFCKPIFLDFEEVMTDLFRGLSSEMKARVCRELEEILTEDSKGDYLSSRPNLMIQAEAILKAHGRWTE